MGSTKFKMSQLCLKCYDSNQQDKCSLRITFAAIGLTLSHSLEPNVWGAKSIPGVKHVVRRAKAKPGARLKVESKNPRCYPIWGHCQGGSLTGEIPTLKCGYKVLSRERRCKINKINNTRNKKSWTKKFVFLIFLYPPLYVMGIPVHFMK